MAKCDTLNIFSWGYYGWGSTAEEFVRLIDRVEAARGFKPPLFADVRISRKVRAVDFREHGFEQIVGSNRYHWFRGLGNQSIVDRNGPRIKIAEPKAAEDLLDLVVRAAEEHRHVIYFCGCQNQRAGRAIACHRWSVGSLLLKAAAKRSLSLETMEWPGGEPIQFALNVSDAVMESHVAPDRNATNIPLGKPANLTELGAIPWASVASLQGSEKAYRIFAGPVRHIRGEWQLQYIEFAGDGARSTQRDLKQAAIFRKYNGFDPRRTSATVARQAKNSSKLQSASIAAATAIEAVGGVIKRNKRGQVTQIDLWDPRKIKNRTRESRVTDEVLAALAEFPAVQHLRLFFARITDAGLEHLGGLKHLKHLWLNNTAVSDSGILHLTKLPALESLWLYETAVTNKSIRILKKSRKLKCLRLGRTAVTDEGVRLLAEMPELTTVDLSETNITEDAVELLSQMPRLRKLELSGTAISTGGVRHLRHLLPSTVITGP